MDASAVRGTLLTTRPLAARPAPELNAIVSARVDLTPTVARFAVRPDDGAPCFEPGQYLALGLVVDGRLLQRPYSTATARGAGDVLEFLIRLVPDGALTPRLWGLHVGDRLRIGRPKGLFTLQAGDRRTHLFVSTGTGLAPFVSMVGSLVGDRSRRSAAAAPRPRAVVVHGVSHVAELAYRDRFERLAADGYGVRYEPVISRPTHPANAGWTGLTGRLDTQLDGLCETHRLDPAESVAYLCGNPELIATAERILTARGFAREAIVSEQYWPLA